MSQVVPTLLQRKYTATVSNTFYCEQFSHKQASFNFYGQFDRFLRNTTLRCVGVLLIMTARGGRGEKGFMWFSLCSRIVSCKIIKKNKREKNSLKKSSFN